MDRRTNIFTSGLWPLLFDRCSTLYSRHHDGIGLTNGTMVWFRGTSPFPTWNDPCTSQPVFPLLIWRCEAERDLSGWRKGLRTGDRGGWTEFSGILEGNGMGCLSLTKLIFEWKRKGVSYLFQRQDEMTWTRIK